MAGVRFQYYTPKIEMPKINTFNMVSKLGETAVNALDRWNLNSAIQKTFGDQGAEKPQSPPAVQNAMSMLTAPTPEQPPSPVEKAKRLLIDGPNPQNTPQSFAENKTDSLITGGPQGQTPQTIARPGETPPQAMSRLIAEHGQGENTGPGEQTLETIRKFEGYSDKPYWDVNAHRTGYGSDTVTLADNSVQRVRPGMKITREDAERDLTRRVGDFQSGIVKKIGQDNWMNMPENGKAALTSVAYNYGSLPDSVAKAAMTPGLEDDAAAIANLQGHNGGVNRNRRLQEAKLMLGTGGVGGDPDVPVAGGAQAGFTIPRQAGMPPAYPGSTQPPIDTRALAQVLSNPQASPALQQAVISRAGGGKPQENWQFVNTNQGMGRFNQVTGQLEMMPGTQARDAVAIGGRLVDRNTGDVIYKRGVTVVRVEEDEDPAIGRFRHHQGMVRRQELPIDHDVDPLAGGHHGLDRLALCLSILLTEQIDPRASGIDHALGANGEGLARLCIAADHTSNAISFVHQLFSGAVIDQQSAFGCRRAGQRQRQTRIVKLTVPVFDAALEPLLLHGGQVFDGLAAGQKFGGAQPSLARQRVIHLEADAVERRVQHFIGRHDKGQRLRQVRSVVQQGCALVQRLAHQRDIALGQIAHAAVHQLSSARRCALGKVHGFQQHYLEATRRRIHSHAQTRGTAADDGQVIDLGLRQTVQQLCASGGQRGRCSGHEYLVDISVAPGGSAEQVSAAGKRGRNRRARDFRSFLKSLRVLS